MAVVIYGGAFDPFHLGHQYAIEQIPKEYDITDLFVVPTFQTPLKSRPLFSDEQRLQLLEKMVPELEGATSKIKIHIDRFEINRQTQTFAIDIIKHFKDRFQTQKIYFLMGSDCFFDLHKWKDIHTITKVISLIVVKRDSIETKKYREYFGEQFNAIPTKKLTIVGESFKDISSSTIKLLFKNNDWEKYSPKTLIPLIYSFKKETL
ncbi:nicotinate (nicotinamide) nucleotide adenylyltransferase [Candidatus Marinamargulisbacteria bacterium SCGC AAA071-K20]|nr:nicotinate (nicotinamide) nucleotide adenylyltransferase [Candidatus Marinamargulisbacteria bacterium SCGC AAA071-K20]